jgi:hypothetical protein
VKKYDLKSEGPGLTSLTHRLAECPEEFLMEPAFPGVEGRKFEKKIHTAALVSDLMEALGGKPLASTDLAAFPRADSPESLNLLRLIQVCCHLFYDPWFRERDGFAGFVLDFLKSGLTDVARVVAADLFVKDPERREELARFCLAGLGLRPAGESEAQALDRLTTVDSVERKRILEETRIARQRAEELREAMARKAAREAASKMTRE